MTGLCLKQAENDHGDHAARGADDGLHHRPGLQCLLLGEPQITVRQPEAGVVDVGQHDGANGMPELHMLMPVLGDLQKTGYKVALVTDGRLSGASGKIPAAIHVTPEALHGGAIGLLRDGDMLRLDAESGRLDCLSELTGRTQAEIDLSLEQEGWGR